MTPTYQTYHQLFAGKPMPLAYVDLDLLAANVRQCIYRAGGKPIRIASKSVRSVDILKWIMAFAPDAFQGILSYAATEALHLCAHGFDDLVVAYPCWNEAEIEAVAAQVAAGKQITLMVDSVEHIQHLEAIMARKGGTLPLCLDIDLSLDLPGLHFGVWRSGITTADKALTVWRAIQASKHLRLDGVMGYEAQIAGLGDSDGDLKSRLIRLLKQRSLPQLRQRRKAIIDALKANRATLRFVNGGGTGSLETTTQEDTVTEIAAGSGFYMPVLFDHYQAFKGQPAAGFAIQIVRQPTPDIYTCLGGGYIASGQVGILKQPIPYLPTGARLLELEGAGEVQTPVTYRGVETLKLGDPIFFRHSKAGELCEHFNFLYLIEGGKLVGEALTYRGEGKKFL
jgi:D-serine deaminase-like pyridoxal phosphate-dependent protein